MTLRSRASSLNISTPNSTDDLPELELATVLPGAVPFKFNENVNDVFRGQILCDSGPVTAFIKDLDARQLANELLAGMIALKVGLPIPRPMLARAAPDTGVGTKIRIAGTDDYLVFASADANASPVLQVLQDNPAGVPQIMQKLANWNGLGVLYGFDTWVANVDRHRGNLLLGDGGDVWAIDHSHCFTGAQWESGGLEPAKKYLNKLEIWMTPCLSHPQKSQAAAIAGVVPGKLSNEEVDKVGEASRAKILLGEDFGAIMAFLKSRAASVPNLSTEALGLLV